MMKFNKNFNKKFGFTSLLVLMSLSCSQPSFSMESKENQEFINTRTRYTVEGRPEELCEYSFPEDGNSIFRLLGLARKASIDLIKIKTNSKLVKRCIENEIRGLFKENEAQFIKLFPGLQLNKDSFTIQHYMTYLDYVQNSKNEKDLSIELGTAQNIFGNNSLHGEKRRETYGLINALCAIEQINLFIYQRDETCDTKLHLIHRYVQNGIDRACRALYQGGHYNVLVHVEDERGNRKALKQEQDAVLTEMPQLDLNLPIVSVNRVEMPPLGLDFNPPTDGIAHPFSQLEPQNSSAHPDDSSHPILIDPEWSKSSTVVTMLSKNLENDEWVQQFDSNIQLHSQFNIVAPPSPQIESQSASSELILRDNEEPKSSTLNFTTLFKDLADNREIEKYNKQHNKTLKVSFFKNGQKTVYSCAFSKILNEMNLEQRQIVDETYINYKLRFQESTADIFLSKILTIFLMSGETRLDSDFMEKIFALNSALLDGIKTTLTTKQTALRTLIRERKKNFIDKELSTNSPLLLCLQPMKGALLPPLIQDIQRQQNKRPRSDEQAEGSTPELLGPQIPQSKRPRHAPSPAPEYYQGSSIFNAIAKDPTPANTTQQPGFSSNAIHPELMHQNHVWSAFSNNTINAQNMNVTLQHHMWPSSPTNAINPEYINQENITQRYSGISFTEEIELRTQIVDLTQKILEKISQLAEAEEKIGQQQNQLLNNDKEIERLKKLLSQHSSQNQQKK